MTYPSVFFINLDRAEKRAIYMWNEIDKLGLRPQTERVSAVDARQGPVRDAFRRNIFSMDCYQLEDSSIACTESHRKAWRRMLELNLDCAVFLEDDMVFTPGFSSAISEIAGSPLKFSVVKLDGVPEKVRLGTPIACGTVSVRPLHQTLYSSGAYMLSRRGAERYWKKQRRTVARLTCSCLSPAQTGACIRPIPRLPCRGFTFQKMSAQDCRR